jgi:hypothetical protein
VDTIELDTGIIFIGSVILMTSLSLHHGIVKDYIVLGHSRIVVNRLCIMATAIGIELILYLWLQLKNVRVTIFNLKLKRSNLRRKTPTKRRPRNFRFVLLYEIL